MIRRTINIAKNATSIGNALLLGLASRSGILGQGMLGMREVLKSEAEYNTLTIQGRSPSRTSFRVELHALADLRGFLDPTDLERFLCWQITEGSKVHLPGIASNQPIHEGYIRLVDFREVEYFFEFFGDIPKKSKSERPKYYFKGAKSIRNLKQIRAWSTLNGGVYEQSTGKRVLDSTLFFGKSSVIRDFIAFLKTVNLQ